MNRRTLIVAGVGCAVLLGAWFLLFWSPAGNDIAEARRRVAEAERQASELEARLNRLLDAQRNLGELTDAAARVGDALPAAPELAEFLLAANDVATTTQVDFLEINPAPPAASAIPGVGGEIRLSFRIDGGYFHVLDYIDGLLALPRLVVIDSVNVTPGGQGPQEGALSVNLSARMFTSAPPGATAEPDPATSTPPTSTPDAVAAPGAASEGGT